MIRSLCIAGLVLFVHVSFAQGDKPPTQAELQRMMQQAQKELDNLDPATKKMMDSLGIKLPDVKKMSKQASTLTDAQIKKGYEDDARVLPLRDAKRIAAINKTPLTEATLPGYIQSITQQLPKALGEKVVTLGEKIYQQTRADYKTSTAIGNTGAGLWMFGQRTLALYVIGKAVKEDVRNDDNINNFAAILSMSGGEQFALPLLSYLDKKYPRNSTVLNNIAQAWFGLGDMPKAIQFANACLAIAPYHPQANMINAKIAESKGNGIEAAVYVKKAIRENYTEEKAEELRKNGGKLKGDDIEWPFPPGSDQLGLANFRHPKYPSSVEECIASEKLWNEFREMCKQEAVHINQQLERAKQVMASNMATRIKADPFSEPFYHNKALPKLESVMNDYDGANKRFDRAARARGEYKSQMQVQKDQYKAAIEHLNQVEGDQTGEGMANKDYCEEKRAVSDAFLGVYNTGLQQKDNAMVEAYRKLLNEMATWSQYTEWEDQFEVSKLSYKLGWLGILSEQDFESVTLYKCGKKGQAEGGKLGLFKDPRCNQSSTLNLGIGTITNTCDRMETKLDLKFVKLGLKQDFGTDKNSTWDQFVSCTVEVGVSQGASIGSGPIKVEAKVGVSAFVEIGKRGIEDAGVKVTGNVKLGTNATDKVLSNGTDGPLNPVKAGDALPPGAVNLSGSIVGAEAKISINSGVSVKGKGILGLLNK